MILIVLQKDLSWCNVDTLRISVVGSGKDLPEYHHWMPCPLIPSSGDFVKTNKKLFFGIQNGTETRDSVFRGHRQL